MRRYAENTSVPVDRSRAEIERCLMKYGATGFGYTWERRPKEEVASIAFGFQERRIRLDIPMPESPKEQRQRWRAVLLVIKAKLEAVETGISVFEDEFMANIMLPDGKSVSEWMRPQIAEAYRIGSMPEMLPMLEGPKS